ncbi:MAG: hypothetical protein ACI9SE_003292, partial [Neolewinella sp.]
MRFLVAALLLFVVDLSAQERVRRTNDPHQKSASERKLEKVSALVKGQCIDGATGRPLAGCTVGVHAWGRRRDDVPKNLLRPEKVVTGADGRFEVRVLAKENYQVSFEAALDGRWPRTGRWHYLIPGSVEDVGDVVMHAGVRAVGKVVDQNGKPLSDIMIGFDELRLYLGCERDKDDKRPLAERLSDNAASGSLAFHLHANKVRYGRSGDDGRVISRDTLPPGTCEIRIANRGLSLIEPKHITIPKTGPMQPVTIVVREEDYLGGIVVDEKGQPVEGVGMHAEFRRNGGGRLASGFSGKDGTFKIYWVEGAGDKASISIADPGPCERPAPTEEFAWGKKDIRIQLRRALVVPVRVVEAGTQKPIEDFAVRAYAINRRSSSSGDRDLRLSGHHDGGKVGVTRMPRGDDRICIIPKDTKLLCATIDVIAAEAMKPVTIEVQRLVPMMVQVLNHEGLPAKNVTVKVVDPGNRPVRGGRKPSVINPRGDSMLAFSTNAATRYDSEVYRATTD